MPTVFVCGSFEVGISGLRKKKGRDLLRQLRFSSSGSYSTCNTRDIYVVNINIMMKKNRNNEVQLSLYT